MISMLFGLLLAAHPIHVSITEVEHNEKAKALQMTLRIFIDDLETSIRNQVKEPELDLLQPGAGRTTDQLVKQYLADHFILKVDKKLARQNYLGHEIEGPALICYIEVENVKRFTALEFTNRVIHETHQDQSNLINVNYQQTVKSLRLTNEKPTDVVVFEKKK
ncbi:MAG: DUF6702 family protein [Bacteroidota bacterium]